MKTKGQRSELIFSVSRFQRFRISLPSVLWPLTSVVLAAAAGTAHGQDALRMSLGYDSAAAQRRLEMENQPYTARWADLKLLASASVDGEWNDNVNLAHTDPQQDFIIRPMGHVGVFWPVTEVNALSFSLGGGYEKYVSHDQYDRPLVTPSAVGWDLFLTNLRLNFHDQFSYEEDPTAWGAVRGTASFGGFNNTVGAAAVWDLHDAVLSFGYNHFNFISSSSTYDYLNRASDLFLLRAGFKVHPAATAGLEVSGGPTAYDQKVLSDNVTASAGGFAQWQATEVIKVESRLGFYEYSFSNEGAAAGGGDQSGVYGSLKLSHRPSPKISYSLEGGREALMGNNSALTEEYYAAASVGWRLIEHISLSPSVRYETATQPIGPFKYNYDRANVNLKLSCPIKQKLTVSLNYRYWLETSGLGQSFDYEQNCLTLQLAYKF
jgi:hypothetical protein